MVREDQAVIREKAIRLAVRTGMAPDLDFVWTTQRQDGETICFGTFRPNCSRTCRWVERCRTLATEPIDASWPGYYHGLDHGTLHFTPSSENRWVPTYLQDDTSALRRRAPI